MKLANLDGRLAVVIDSHAIDVAEASQGRFDADPAAIYERWDEFVEWAKSESLVPTNRIDRSRLQSPSPRPRQVFGIGLNYADHAAEANLPLPDDLVVFTKFPSSIAGAEIEVTIPPGDVDVDWEVELVVIIGRQARAIAVGDAWSHVAGLSVGQDISERKLQLAGPNPQYALGKSHENFSPIGPWLVTPDEFTDPDDLEIECTVNGERVQFSRTSSLVFSVPRVVSRLSEVVVLYPGDVIFTGTTGGVGIGRKPPSYLERGDVVVSRVEGIGTIRQVFV